MNAELSAAQSEHNAALAEIYDDLELALLKRRFKDGDIIAEMVRLGLALQWRDIRDPILTKLERMQLNLPDCTDKDIHNVVDEVLEIYPRERDYILNNVSDELPIESFVGFQALRNHVLVRLSGNVKAYRTTEILRRKLNTLFAERNQTESEALAAETSTKTDKQ